MSEPEKPLDRLVEIDREATEREREQSEFHALALAVLDALPDALIVTKASGEIVLFNDKAQHYWRYVRKEVIGQSVEILLPEAYREIHARHRAKYNDSDFSPFGRTMGIGLQIMGLRKDGVTFPIDITLSQMVTPGGLYNMALARRPIAELIDPGMPLDG